MIKKTLKLWLLISIISLHSSLSSLAMDHMEEEGQKFAGKSLRGILIKEQGADFEDNRRGNKLSAWIEMFSTRFVERKGRPMNRKEEISFQKNISYLSIRKNILLGRLDFIFYQ